MNNGPVRKFNMAYLLAYIFVPLIISVLGLSLIHI